MSGSNADGFAHLNPLILGPHHLWVSPASAATMADPQQPPAHCTTCAWQPAVDNYAVENFSARLVVSLLEKRYTDKLDNAYRWDRRRIVGMARLLGGPSKLRRPYQWIPTSPCTRRTPKWRNWQTRRIQNPVRFTPGVGSTPTFGISPEYIHRKPHVCVSPTLHRCSGASLGLGWRLRMRPAKPPCLFALASAACRQNAP